MRQRPLPAALGCLLAAIVLLAAADVWAVAVTGTITAAGQPVAEATVTLEPVDEQGRSTGAAPIPVGGRDGRIQGDVPPGTYRLQIRAPGYRTVTDQVTVRAGQPLDVSRALEISYAFSLRYGLEVQYHDIDTEFDGGTQSVTVNGQTFSQPASGEGVEFNTRIVQGGLRVAGAVPFRAGGWSFRAMPWANAGASNLRIGIEENGQETKTLDGTGAFVGFGVNLHAAPPGIPVEFVAGYNHEFHIERDMSVKSADPTLRDLDADAEACRMTVFAVGVVPLHAFGVQGGLGRVMVFAGPQAQWYDERIDVRFTVSDPQFGTFQARQEEDHRERGVLGGKFGVMAPLSGGLSARAEGVVGDGYWSVKAMVGASFTFGQ